METLGQLRRELDTFADLATVVKTMKALAIVNMREYEQAVSSINGYYRTVERALQATLRDLPPPSPSPRRRGGESVGAVLFGSDHGLCGRFNEDLADYARERLAEAATKPGERALTIGIGARTRALLGDADLEFTLEMRVPGSASSITKIVRGILLELDRWRRAGRADQIYLLYNRPLPGGRYHPTGVQLLPLDLQRFHRMRRDWPSASLPMHTMEMSRLLPQLLRQYLFVSLFRAAAESLAAENSSRWNAMQLADSNLTERRQELLQAFRRQRQEHITTEMLDVVTGYEASRGVSDGLQR